MTIRTTRPDTTGFTVGYHLGSIGTWLRIILGVLLPLGYLATQLTAEGITAGQLAEVVGWFLALFAAYFTAQWLLGERFFARVNPWVSTVILYGPVFVVPYLDSLPLALRLGLSLYIAASVLVAVFIRYGGCEMIGIPSLILRRLYVVYCPWNAVDLADKAITDSRWSHLLSGRGPKLTAAAAMAGVLAGYPELTPPLPHLPRPVFWGVVILAGAAALGTWAVVRAGSQNNQTPRRGTSSERLVEDCSAVTEVTPCLDGSEGCGRQVPHR